MNILITILTVIASIIAIFLIIAVFTKKEYVIEREAIINKPKHEVFNYLRFLKNQDNYNKWVMMDPNMRKEFRGIDGSVGFVYAWDGNKKAGKGEQELKHIKDGESIDVELRFIRPFEAVANAPMRVESITENQTKVKWGMRGKTPFPMNFMNLFTSGMLGKDLEISLSTLKGILEK